VLLTGEYAYKIKKPLKLPFLDFSSLEQRKHFCDEELRLNRRLAPDLYLAVVPIGGTPESPRIGSEPAIEYAVKMRQFPSDARLDRRLGSGGVDAAMLRAFADRLARFHSSLRVLEPRDARKAAVAAMADNFSTLEEHVPRADLDAVRTWVERAAPAVVAAIRHRAASGRYRECHGDLHLENMLVHDGEIVAYDALEFDPTLREIDVASEIAFLTMDLGAHGRSDLAFVFLNRYLEASGDYDSLEVLRFYLVYRALVRAKVRAIKAAQNAAESGRDALEPYLTAARGVVAPRTPVLVITHGLSCSGKTHLTDQLLGPLNAVRARSDLERKRLHGLAEDARTGSPVEGGIYDVSAGRRAYARLAEIAGAALRNGFDALVDATFLRRADRDEFAELASAARARFAILDCHAPESELRRRLAAREGARRDASEAGIEVLEQQLVRNEPLGADERRRTVRVATDRELDASVVAERLGRL